MTRTDAIARLKAHQGELNALGLRRLSLFGSMARGDSGPSSDVDVAAVLDPAAHIDLFRLAALSERLTALLGASVDLITEPARSARLQAEIERDRVRVF